MCVCKNGDKLASSCCQNLFAFAKSLVSLKLSENDWFEAQRHRTRKPFSAGRF